MDTVRTRKEYFKESNQKIIDNRKKKHKKLFYLFVLFSFILFLAVVCVLRIKKFSLANVNISGNVILESKDISDALYANRSGNFLFVIPKRSLPVINTKKMELFLIQHFPRIEKVSVVKKYPNQLSVSISERGAETLWCKGDMVIVRNADSECYFVDKNGVIFSRAPFISGDIYFTFNTRATGTLDTVLPNKELLDEVFLINKTLVSFGVKPLVLSSLDDGTYELYVNEKEPINTSSTKLKIILNPKDSNELVDNIQVAFDNLKIGKEHSIDEYAYIDLRFKGKIFYKKK